MWTLTTDLTQNYNLAQLGGWEEGTLFAFVWT